MLSPFVGALATVTHTSRRLSGLFAVGVLAAQSAACGAPPLEPRLPDPGAPHFTVMSYNIELGAKGEPSTLKSIGDIGADLVGLQEVTPEAEAWLRDTYAELYPYQLYQAKGG